MFSIRRSNIILFIAGEGGHYAQAKRLHTGLKEGLQCPTIVLTDKLNNKIDENIPHYELGDLRNKSGFSFQGFIFHLFNCLFVVLPLLARYRVNIISTGPGIAIFPSLIVRLAGGKIVHIETWSRFYSKSGAGRVMYYLSNKFYVQNEELLKIYPKSIYSGRL
ncbi:Oligosaccharide biosynthesis Alg14 like family protein [Vibrio chagasii]|uniref:PssD/Cps14F family polysaccharide biosynthesis glycosyltransferase n=1 Tax=Vibrio chagasii TaxID=170679 RepID=UPI00337E8AA9|nr:Oligosaccharide biosynthesis Alg14 like family protein [Vibrio chagasii]CAH7101265.1 Oligosaccharide biosynthesis Alg14 like family protein [Vibrio chagasii]CAH7117594.1 Oligosaccharide biosynthesis Alg14 like family protein [Vibrio chagasii]CAH7329930.1 Oligosaccharide biosynthesis Alg14 like family protein [Vibrio chagasii]